MGAGLVGAQVANDVGACCAQCNVNDRCNKYVAEDSAELCGARRSAHVAAQWEAGVLVSGSHMLGGNIGCADA